MTLSEKYVLCEKIKDLITDWDTSYNNGRNEGIRVALAVVEAFPLEDDLIIKNKQEDEQKTN